MPQCPNCSYKLVLLSNRLKYRCALCSKLYSQKEIDNKEFRIWNQHQRRLDLEFIKSKKKLKLTKQEKLQKARESGKKYRDKIRKMDNKRHREYWTKNSKHINSKRKERYNLKREQILNYQRQWEKNNPHKYKIRKRLSDLREQQRQLALQLCKNKQYKLYNLKIQDFLPTFVLSDLLLKIIKFKNIYITLKR